MKYFRYLLFIIVLPVFAAPTSYPSLNAVSGVSDPSVAVEVGGVVDYLAILPFINIAKSGRVWRGTTAVGGNRYVYESFKEDGYLDSNGYVTDMPPGVTNFTMVWDWTGLSADAPEFLNYAAGAYTMTYDGAGDITVNGATNVSYSPGLITFNIAATSIWSLTITDTVLGNHLKNFEIVKDEHRDIYNAGEIFQPGWIDKLEDWRQIRFMDWQESNNNKDTRDYSDLIPEDYFTYSSLGVPYEVQIKLANKIGADPWFNLPPLANDGFGTSLATLVEAELDDDLVATFELGNENWNFVFSHVNNVDVEIIYDTESNGPFADRERIDFSNGSFGYMTYKKDDGATGRLYFDGINTSGSGGQQPQNNNTITGVTSGATALVNGAAVLPVNSMLEEGKAKFTNEGMAHYHWYGMRHAELMTEITAVFSGQLSRIKRAVGTQAVNPTTGTIALTATTWQSEYPGEYIAPHSVTDAIASTSYFGSAFMSTPDAREDLVAAINAGGIDEDAWMKSVMSNLAPATADPNSDGVCPSSATGCSSYYNINTVPEVVGERVTPYINGLASTYGLDVVLYEGGQHMHHSFSLGLTPEESASVGAFWNSFVRGQNTADLYDILWDDIVAAPLDGPFFQFGHMSLHTDAGTWGMYRSQEDTNLRATYLETQNSTVAAWWESRGGEHFQNGVNNTTAAGTGDTIAGSNRADVILSGAGDDTIYPGPDPDSIHCGDGNDTVLFKGTSVAATIIQTNGVDGDDGYDVTTALDGTNHLFDCETAQFDDDTDTVALDTYVPPSNLAPTVNADDVGSDFTITLPIDSQVMAATCTDDGNPIASLTCTWTVVSGPNTPTYNPNATTVDVTLENMIEGTYVMKLTGDDTALTSEDTVTIVVNGAEAPPGEWVDCPSGVVEPGLYTISGQVVLLCADQ